MEPSTPPSRIPPTIPTTTASPTKTNSAKFSASIMPGKTAVSLKQDVATGYTVSLPDGVSWNPLDTVIKLEIDGDSTRRMLGVELEKLKSKPSAVRI